MTTNTDQRTTAPGTDQRPQPRIAVGPLGRALYLSDLVRWLMRKHEATRAQVVKEHLCPVLLEQGPVLYGVGRGGDAKALPDREWFKSGDGQQAYLRSHKGIGHAAVSKPRHSSLGRGMAGSVAWLRWAWSEAPAADSVMEHDQTAGAYLAVSEADARRYWGWKAVAEAEGAAAESVSVFPLADWAALVAYRKVRKAELVANGKPRQGVAWESSDPADNQLNVLHRWYDGLGGDEAAATQIAKALGCSRQAVNAALVKPWDKNKSWPAPLVQGAESK